MENEFLRHTLSAIAYRFQKAVRNSGDGFGNFSAGKGSRTPNEIVNHMYHVLKATRIYIVEERFEKNSPEQINFSLEIERFNGELKNMDNVLADEALEIDFAKRLLQGPFSDILTHIGQISMLCRMDGRPIEGEDFSAAPIQTGIG